VQNWLQARSVVIDVFDLWDEHRIRLCRGCGKPTYRKDGTRGHQKFCSPQCRSRVVEAWGMFQWKFAVSEKLNQGPEYPFNRYFVQCEDCQQFLEYTKVEIHHIQPVATLTVENFELCWEIANLKRLCIPCHDKSPDHQKIYAGRSKTAFVVEKYAQFRKIDAFLAPHPKILEDHL
jgi:5-methylcytosine-specific restriction endonuclease McrA